MPDYNNLQITNTEYIPQYQGLPLQELEKTGEVLQDRYYRNLAEMSKIDLLNMQRMANPGDQELNNQLSEEYKQALQQLTEQENFENLTGQISLLSRKYLGDKKRIHLEENFKRTQQEQEMLKNLNLSGKSAVGYINPATGKPFAESFSSLDPETGEPRLYQSKVAAQLEYDKRMEEFFDDMTSNIYGKPLSELSDQEQKVFAAGISPYLQTGKVESISDKRVKGMLEDVLVRYKNTPEYKQQAELLGQTDEEIRRQLAAVGSERVFSRSTQDFVRDLTFGMGASEPSGGLAGPVLFSGNENATQYTKKLLDNIVGEGSKITSPQQPPAYGMPNMPNRGLKTPSESDPVKGNYVLSLATTMENMSKLPEGSIESKVAAGFLKEYQSYIRETKGVDMSPNEIITMQSAQTIGETREMEKAVRDRYEDKIKQLSSQQVFKIGGGELIKEYKTALGLLPVSRNSDGEPVFDESIEFLRNAHVVDKQTGKRMPMQEFMRGPANVDDWFEGDEFEKEDYDELKKTLGIGNTFSLPTSSSDFGLEVTINDKAYVLESPVQQNQDLSSLVRGLNNDLIDPTLEVGEVRQGVGSPSGQEIPYLIVPGMQTQSIPGATRFVLSREVDPSTQKEVNKFYVVNSSGLALRSDGGVAKGAQEAYTLTPQQVIRDYGNLFIMNITGNRQYTPEGQYKDPRSN